MVGALGGKIDAGEVQLYCVDSVDMESWYNKQVPPRWRIARHVQFDDYLIHEVVPLVRQKNHDWHLVSLGCSFGGFHAVNVALKHPDVFTGFLSMSGAFDLRNFLNGYYDQDCTSTSRWTFCLTWAITGFWSATGATVMCWPRDGTTNAWDRTSGWMEL
jgi:esterase/lipase superfamily enzyme